MGIMLTATFGSRQDAERTVERLVEEFAVDRGEISVADGDGGVALTAEVADEATAELVRSAFGEFDAQGVVEIDQPVP